MTQRDRDRAAWRRADEVRAKLEGLRAETAALSERIDRYAERRKNP